MQHPDPRKLLPLLAMLLPSFFTCGESPAEEAVDYAREIQPILADHCFECHGQDPSSREADLRLDKRDVAVASSWWEDADITGG